MAAPLRHRQFRLLFTGQLISNLGDWLDFLAIITLVAYTWKRGEAALAGIAIVVAFPWVVVAPFAGVLADRWPKKSVLVGTDLARAGIVCGLIFVQDLPLLLVLVGMKSVVSTLFLPAEQATLRSVVPEEQLQSAVALSEFVGQATKVIGPALGGLLVSFTNPRFPFAIDAATFLASALVLSRLERVDVDATDETADDSDGSPGYWRELREGLTFIRRRRALVFVIVSMSATVFLLLGFDTLSPLAFIQLGASKALFGFAVASVGLGGVLGAIVVGRNHGSIGPFVLMGSAKIAIGSVIGVLGCALLLHLRPPALVWAPLLFIVGVASAALLIGAPTVVQLETPPALMGRVSASVGAVPTVFQVLAPIVSAAIAKRTSVGFVFASAGGALAALGVVVLVLRPPLQPVTATPASSPAVAERE